MDLKVRKMATLLCGVTVFMCGFQGPVAMDFTVSSFAKSNAASAVSSSVSSSASSTVSSAVSSAVSAAASSKTSSQTASSKVTSKPAPKPVVKTTPKVATKKDLVEEDPQYSKDKDDAITKPASSKPASSKPASSKPASSNPVSSNHPASSSANLSDGWQVVNGLKMYYRDGAPLVGWNTLDGTEDGKRYYFDEKGAVKTRLGIDVSKYQGIIDWNKVKADGIEYAIIRLGFRGWGGGVCMTDPYFQQNYQGAKAAGISIGVYFFSQAISIDEAVEEASYTLNLIKGLHITEPVVFDTENVSDPGARTNLAGLTAKDRTDFITTFCDMVKAAGYRTMITSYKSWFLNNLEFSRLNGFYDIWIADYSRDATQNTVFGYPYKYWQYSSNGSVNGISGRVDMDVTFY